MPQSSIAESHDFGLSMTYTFNSTSSRASLSLQSQHAAYQLPSQSVGARRQIQTQSQYQYPPHPVNQRHALHQIDEHLPYIPYSQTIPPPSPTRPTTRPIHPSIMLGEVPRTPPKHTGYQSRPVPQVRMISNEPWLDETIIDTNIYKHASPLVSVQASSKPGGRVPRRPVGGTNKRSNTQNVDKRMSWDPDARYGPLAAPGNWKPAQQHHPSSPARVPTSLRPGAPSQSSQNNVQRRSAHLISTNTGPQNPAFAELPAQVSPVSPRYRAKQSNSGDHIVSPLLQPSTSLSSRNSTISPLSGGDSPWKQPSTPIERAAPQARTDTYGCIDGRDFATENERQVLNAHGSARYSLLPSSGVASAHKSAKTHPSPARSISLAKPAAEILTVGRFYASCNELRPSTADIDKFERQYSRDEKTIDETANPINTAQRTDIFDRVAPSSEPKTTRLQKLLRKFRRGSRRTSKTY